MLLYDKYDKLLQLYRALGKTTDLNIDLHVH